MSVLVNLSTNTVHRRDPGDRDGHTACGVTYHLEHDRLRTVPFEEATSDGETSKCGRCFDDGGGY